MCMCVCVHACVCVGLCVCVFYVWMQAYISVSPSGGILAMVPPFPIKLYSVKHPFLIHISGFEKKGTSFKLIDLF